MKKIRKVRQQRYEFSFLLLPPYRSAQAFSFRSLLQFCIHIKSFYYFDFVCMNHYFHFLLIQKIQMDQANLWDYCLDYLHRLKTNSFEDKLYLSLQIQNSIDRSCTSTDELLLSNSYFFTFSNHRMLSLFLDMLTIQNIDIKILKKICLLNFIHNFLNFCQNLR